MKIIKPTNDRWDAWAAATARPELLQSSRWSLIYQPTAVNLVATQGDRWVMGLRFVIRRLAAARYLFSPRGPLVAADATEPEVAEAWRELSNEVLRQCRDLGCLFWRFEPAVALELWPADQRLRHIEDLEPSLTWLTPLRDDAAMLSAMHAKTRYNIKLSEKKNLQWRLGDADDLEIWWNLLKQTGERDGFKTHDLAHYQAMLQSTQGLINLALVGDGQRYLAAGLFGCFGNRAAYLHGASDYDGRQLMAPYFLHWNMMKYHRDLGATCYDWFGINEQKWPGISRFKKGFGGEAVNYVGTWDLPSNDLYYRIYQGLRRWRRRLI